MGKEHCPLKIVLASREVKCLYRRRLSLCPEHYSQCSFYAIHSRNSLNFGGLVGEVGESTIVPQTKAYEEPKVI